MRQYNIAIYCSTIAESEEEALEIALQQIKDGSAYVEIEDELLEDDE
jgi:DNA-directed RNA polymerase subunit K/omega